MTSSNITPVCPKCKSVRFVRWMARMGRYQCVQCNHDFKDPKPSTLVVPPTRPKASDQEPQDGG